MVESAPMYIEYLCQPYISCEAFYIVVALLLVCCFASWFAAWFVLRRALKEIIPEK